MKPIEGCSYDPETIEMMQSVLDEAWGSIPLKQQARVSKTEMAARILKLAASGVRDPGSPSHLRANNRHFPRYRSLARPLNALLVAGVLMSTRQQAPRYGVLTPERCRHHAEACRQMLTSANSEMRKRLVEIIQAWEQLADQLEACDRKENVYQRAN